MTITDIVNSIYRRTKTNATSFTAANMLLAINSAQNRVNSVIRKYITNYRPTDFTSSDVSTGTRVPVLDAEFHEAIPLWASYEYALENLMPTANSLLGEYQTIERQIADFYGRRNYQEFTVTIATPGVVTKDKHKLQNNDRISMITSGALPTGLSADTWYYVVVVDDHTFKLTTTKNSTTYIDTSGSQSGTHYYFTDKVPLMRAIFHSNK